MEPGTELSNLQLMALQINTLFCCDSAGRLRCVNEIGEPAAPRFFMARTSQGNLWRVRYDLPASVVDQLDILCGAEPVVDDFRRPPRYATEIKRILSAHGAFASENRGPAYRVPASKEPATGAILLSEANAGCLTGPFAWLQSQLGHPDVGPAAAVVNEGRAVSLCFCSRRPARATEAGVETMPSFRGRGYATAAVACWAAAVHAQGILPLYSTSWDNHASQAVARKLEMVQYGEDWSIK